MSFAGYYQIICCSGHYTTCDIFEYPDFEETEDPDIYGNIWKCTICSKPANWWNMVDLTNGSYCVDWDENSKKCLDPQNCSSKQLICCKNNNGRIDGFVELRPEQMQSEGCCSHCGSTIITSYPVYKIPNGIGHIINEKPAGKS